MTTKEERTADEELATSPEQASPAATHVDAATPAEAAPSSEAYDTFDDLGATGDLTVVARARHAMPMDVSVAAATTPVASTMVDAQQTERKPAHAAPAATNAADEAPKVTEPAPHPIAAHASHDFWGADVSAASTPATDAPVQQASVPEVTPAPQAEDVAGVSTPDPEATTNLWASAQTAETLQQAHTPTIRAELLSLPDLDEDAQGDGADHASTADVATDDFESTGFDGAAEAVDAVPETPVEPAPVKEKSGTARKVLKVVGIAAGALLVVYVGGSVFFMSHFMPHTRVNGQDVSLKSVSELSENVTQTGEKYVTHVTGDGMDLTITAADIELGYDGNAYSGEAQAQIDPWKWPAIIWNEHDFHASTGITFNQDKLNVLVTSAVDAINANSQPPTNATMTYDEKKAMFVSVPDALGTMVDRDNSIAAISEGVRTLQDSIELKDPQLAQPAVREDDERLAGVINEANEIVRLAIPLRIAGRDAMIVDANLIKGWLSTNDHCELIIDTEAIKNWTQGDLSKNFDSVGTTRVYTRPDGKQVSVSGGDYGWNLDGEQLADVLAAYLLNKNGNALDVPMKSSAAAWNPGGPDWGARYIDVDMTEQYVRVYDENSQIVLESDCVTGVPYHATDEGVYTIYEHSENMTLVGLDYNGDGKPDYETPVSYWMPFNGGQGLHDAYWRGAFGGNIYEYDGSHGCVNLPSDVAAQLFEWSHVGDVVVVHW